MESPVAFEAEFFEQLDRLVVVCHGIDDCRTGRNLRQEGTHQCPGNPAVVRDTRPKLPGLTAPAAGDVSSGTAGSFRDEPGCIVGPVPGQQLGSRSAKGSLVEVDDGIKVFALPGEYVGETFGPDARRVRMPPTLDRVLVRKVEFLVDKRPELGRVQLLAPAVYRLQIVDRMRYQSSCNPLSLKVGIDQDHPDPPHAVFVVDRGGGRDDTALFFAHEATVGLELDESMPVSANLIPRGRVLQPHGGFEILWCHVTNMKVHAPRPRTPFAHQERNLILLDRGHATNDLRFNISGLPRHDAGCHDIRVVTDCVAIYSLSDQDDSARVPSMGSLSLQKHLRATAAILFFAVVVFLAAEFVLLIFDDWIFASSFYVFDPDMGFRVRPYARYGDAVANEFGFNDRDYPHAADPRKFRILFLSDSFSWMGGPDSNYTAVLEHSFAARFGPERVEVINGGYSQTHTAEQLVVLKKFGLQYEPDLVVLGVFAGNDLFDARRNRKRIVVGGVTTDVFVDRDMYWTLWGKPVVLQSRLYLFLREKWTVFWHLFRAQASERETEAHVPLPQEEYLHSLNLRMEVADMTKQDEFRDHYQYVFESLAQMRDVLQEHHAAFVVSVFPDEIQVNRRLREKFIRHYNLDASVFHWDRVQRLLEKFCLHERIEFMDLLDRFRTVSETGHVLYLPNDSHWNEEGNRLAAQFFYEMLSERVERELQARDNTGRAASSSDHSESSGKK